ncbi:MAG: hypothetical protein KC586_23085 [Myxococcales bacterium]|nr:hypothetical protein [Myxococcales bacterium]
MLPRSFFALALGLAACTAQTGDPSLLDEAEAQEAELRTSIGDLTYGSQACWWDSAPQVSCDVPYGNTAQSGGRIPTCNTCSCLDCFRVNVWGSQALRVQLREEGQSMDDAFSYTITDPAQLRPFIVVGVGSQTTPSDYELIDIDPYAVIGDATNVEVPVRFQNQGVYVWFVRKDGKYSTPLPPSWVPNP